MAARKPPGGVPKIKAPDGRETAKDLAETAKHQQIVDAHQRKLAGRNISGSQPRR